MSSTYRFPALLLVALLCSLLARTAGAQNEGVVRAPFITTPAEVVARMLALAGTGPADTVYDLGSGDGRIPIAAARLYGARGVGLELDPELVEKSRAAAAAAGVSERTEFRVEDVLLADVRPASVVTIYLLPSLMDRLSTRLLYEARPGTRIVTHAFAFPSWKPDKVETVRLPDSQYGRADQSTVMLWVVPAQARGRYRANEPSGSWSFTIHQNFQEIELEARLDSTPLRIDSARLSGAGIEWRGSVELEGKPTAVSFRGRVSADRMLGELLVGGQARPFAAQKLP